MWSLIAAAASSASGILILLGVVASLIGIGAFEQHKIDANALTSLKAQYAQATAAALAKGAMIQQANDERAIAAASSEASVQASRVAALQQELADVQSHFHVKAVTASCVPYGFLRVLYAGSHGSTADSIGYSAGQSDDACSPVGWAQLASEILHNYERALANGTQLDDLTALLAKQGVKVK